MTERLALAGARIFDGDTWFDDHMLIVEDGIVADLVPATPEATRLDGGMLVPGFIDLQVNGGGGALLNESPTVETIRTMCETYARFGTTGILPTLITDTPQTTARAIAAGAQAASIPGFLGLHLEGPHLAAARKGAHDPALIRPMTDADLAALVAARPMLTTVAVESVTPQQVAALAGAGIVVSIGHSDATYAAAKATFDAGATMATHLFNAMSQLGNREPGLVGAALDDDRISCGLIADGIHVHPASIRIAMRAKQGPGRLVLITDAMSVTGTDRQTFTLNGRTIHRRNGALRLDDGTLAGADLTMIDAVRFMHGLGFELGEVLRMASLYPAQVLRLDSSLGHLRPGARADFVHLSAGLRVLGASSSNERPFTAQPRPS